MPIIVTIILVGILAGSGIIVMASMQDATRMPALVTSTNESLATANKAGVTLAAGNSARDGVCNAVTAVVNATGNVAIGIGNFTTVGCKVYNATILSPTITNATTLKYTYTYTISADTAASNGTGSALNSIGDLTHDWIPILLIVLAAGIVLSALLGAFNQKRN